MAADCVLSDCHGVFDALIHWDAVAVATAALLAACQCLDDVAAIRTGQFRVFLGSANPAPPLAADKSVDAIVLDHGCGIAVTLTVAPDQSICGLPTVRVWLVSVSGVLDSVRRSY